MSRLVKIPQGHAVVEFILVFPFFLMLAWGTWDLALLCFARISLQRDCWAVARDYAAGGILPAGRASHAFLTLQSLPTLPSSTPHRAKRTKQLVQLELAREIKLHFPLLRLILKRTTLNLKARSVALRISYE